MEARLAIANHRRPGDITCFLANGQCVYCDVAVTNPVSPTNYRRTRSHAAPALTAASLTVEYKINKYRADFDYQRRIGRDVRFLPMVCETYGGWDEAARRYLRTLAGRSARNSGALSRSQRESLDLLHTELDVVLQRFNAMMITDSHLDLFSLGRNGAVQAAR